MRKYHKRFKKCHIFKRKRSKLINKNKTYFDKLYIRIFLSSLLLLALLGSKNLLKLTIFDNINNNINILPIINLFTNVYDLNEDIEVNLTNNYDNTMIDFKGMSYKDANNILKLMGVKYTLEGYDAGKLTQEDLLNIAYYSGNAWCNPDLMGEDFVPTVEAELTEELEKEIQKTLAQIGWVK